MVMTYRQRTSDLLALQTSHRAGLVDQENEFALLLPELNVGFDSD